VALDLALQIALPFVVAAGSAWLATIIMRARMEVAVSKEREALAAAQAIIEAQKVQMEDRVHAAQEAARRQALDEALGDFRVEERSYMRELKSMFSARRIMVVQERLYFRNIPLSNWVEHEMLLDEGADARDADPSDSVFAPPVLASRHSRRAELPSGGDSK